MNTKDRMRVVAAKFDAQTIRTLAKLHDQIGHPSAKALSHELHLRKCPKPWVACADFLRVNGVTPSTNQDWFTLLLLRLCNVSITVDTDKYVVKWQGDLKLKLVSNVKPCSAKKGSRNSGSAGLALPLSCVATCVVLTCQIIVARR